MSFYQWQKAAAALFFPQRHCLNCGALAVDRPLCAACEQGRSSLRHCPLCASFIAATETERYLCPDCRHHHPSFTAAAAALPYEGRLREILIAFKYQQCTGFRRPLAALLLEVLAERYADIAFSAIVPVPLHPARLRQRGYNQAELLSQLIAKETGLPHHPEWLQRSEDTPPLAELGRGERLKTLRSVFTAVPEVAGQQLLLIDDIFTTGATAESCSRALLQQGASGVYVLAVAAGYALP